MECKKVAMTANSNYNEVRVVSDSVGEGKREYGWDGSYHPSFPNRWIENHEHDTGPEQCSNCAYYGSYQGQFIGYCCNCAIHVYEGQRGRGFIGEGIELVDERTWRWVSAYETYLSHVEFARFTDELPAQVKEEDSQNQEADDSSMPDLEFVGKDSVFDTHFEGGYADF